MEIKDDLKQDIVIDVNGMDHSLKYKSKNTMCHSTFYLYLLRGKKDWKFKVRICYEDTTIECGKDRTVTYIKDMADLKRELKCMFIRERRDKLWESRQYEFYVESYADLMEEYYYQEKDFYKAQAIANEKLLQDKAKINVIESRGIGEINVYDDTSGVISDWDRDKLDEQYRCLHLKMEGEGHYYFSQHWRYNWMSWDSPHTHGSEKIRDLFFQKEDMSRFQFKDYGFRPDIYKSKAEFKAKWQKLDDEYHAFIGVLN